MKSIGAGRGFRKFYASTYPARWPTLSGENPPQGIPYRCVEISFGSRCLQLRLWNWRRKEQNTGKEPS